MTFEETKSAPGYAEAHHKVAQVYMQAFANNHVELTAENYGVENLPEHMKVALYKEAIIPAGVARAASHLGGSISRGLGSAASKLNPGKMQDGLNKAVKWTDQNKQRTGAIAAGGTAATLAGGGALAGRASKG